MTAVLWLDGAFGAGKTATARQVLELRLWRRLVVEHVEAVLEERERSLVVPMSLFAPLHVDETVGELRRRGVDVHHVRLLVDRTELERRILTQRTSDDEATDVGTRAFRLAQLDAGLAATSGLGLAVAGRSPRDVAQAALDLCGLQL